MSYQALARKWRPQDFSSVVGQEPIVAALRNALAEGRIAQAYLFSGIRGVGKTTVARVLAKALNCENGPAADPCNECTACIEITRGSDLDVLEVDAATYSKVEQVRDLTESLQYGPARDRYKVVVLDEVHRLSRQAFDALLKIVEEPPPHLAFIFATTEIDAVPATILSRCQEYRFRRVPVPTLVEHLRRLCQAEEIEASDAALVAVARAGEGSVRDSVALLDQLATYGQGTITVEAADRVLGGLGSGFAARVLQALTAGDRAAVLELARAVEEEGQDPRHAHAQLLDAGRAALHLAAGADAQWLDLAGSELEELSALAGEAGYENLLRLMHNLLAGENTVRRSDAPGLALEIAWLRAAELPRLVALESLLGGADPAGAAPAPGGTTSGGTASRGPASGGPRRAAARTRRTTPAASEPAAGKAKAAPAVQAPAPPAAPEPPAVAPEAAPEEPEPAGEPGTLERLLQELDRRHTPLAAALHEAAGLELVGEELRIYTNPDDRVIAGRLERPAQGRALDEALLATYGRKLSWRLAATPEGWTGGNGTAGQGGAAEAPADPDAENPRLAEAREHPVVQAVLDIFNGRVEAVETQPPTGGNPEHGT